MQVYTNSRAFVPSALSSSVRVVENKVSEAVLTSLDRKVAPSRSKAAGACWQACPLHACCACPLMTNPRPWALLCPSKTGAG